MSLQEYAYPLRVDKTVMEKFKIVAKNNGRSVNKEIEFIMKNIVSEYEKTNGIILISTEQND